MGKKYKKSEKAGRRRRITNRREKGFKTPGRPG
jgi:hypothetical protein